MTLAVTAVSGQLGAAIARQLLTMNLDQQVIGLARNPEKVTDLDMEIRKGDFGDPAGLERSLQGVDTVLMVSLNGAPDERIGLHRNLIDAARAAGVKKIVYTSVQGADDNNSFSPIIQSNRQTEADVRDSGMAWSIGRNGIYIEPDVEYIESYIAAGEIANSAGEGRCGYTSRPELAVAYAQMMLDDAHIGQTYFLHGPLLTQAQLTGHLNDAFDASLVYRPMTKAEYLADRTAELGDFLGTVIAGIYEGIHDGLLDRPSDFEKAAGRPHQSWENYFSKLKN